ncbi:hypothetical protein GCM10022224_056730 [Nonomuraea antimicrobica]|uniref:Lipoprotein n=1 Tax=Nonomuraea antimicrobica TaxID=561173 RepID=A0ABP7C9S0_9ACTN
MLTRFRVAAAALLASAALSGCGNTVESTAAPSPTAAKDKRHQFEAVKADCMKQNGFKYVPFVPEQVHIEADKKRVQGDYQAMLKYRQQYGFGVFAEHVYPEHFNAKGGGPDGNPNGKIQSTLSKAQMQAYSKALNACQVKGYKQLLGLDVKSENDYYTQFNKASRRAEKAELNSDPELVELATAMATCLKGKGNVISDTTPIAMSGRGFDEFLAQQDKIGREQNPDVPDVAPPKKEGEVMMQYWPTLTPEQAKPYLNKEIKAALDDLECGKAFYPAYLPKSLAVQRKVEEQYGL